ncbi:hypothetical protein A2715_00735 [Candidatus Woesebacteria bacterium RIFCSPHIGHO2_01_FULL_39_32]|uniref:Uncharacterized protein n=1 Tax=Candidatus Woesebacteria bacterium RIFCSPLOWO2_01_FULL_39_25 TaxID=1802521 RepID=A0A1F8BI64_9BACT|nr:MAG: hypothetical protein A2124_03535 [Candidatus Woesebacteria bacterium GWB1_37_5]OGM24441.1 MAG: hypothetical protein A2715_00735 [Candidatus Woesebacteria bacterium RIFCSPHIGHO2_01_FULL_39_32]OGM35554.1 MAG: hypothetical protein A3F01_02535 [Candidatus Woesebacteria bacterium RIFCSPHIGHO2_12_FULL_38_11]OGM63747.1 MAG: hypothetical protein A2893_02070 [Candidatus Woesebacteria bacterium RIFCSPLOWO2_01_FULL_39_25]
MKDRLSKNPILLSVLLLIFVFASAIVSHKRSKVVSEELSKTSQPERKCNTEKLYEQPYFDENGFRRFHIRNLEFSLPPDWWYREEMAGNRREILDQHFIRFNDVEPNGTDLTTFPKYEIHVDLVREKEPEKIFEDLQKGIYDYVQFVNYQTKKIKVDGIEGIFFEGTANPYEQIFNKPFSSNERVQLAIFDYGKIYTFRGVVNNQEDKGLYDKILNTFDFTTYWPPPFTEIDFHQCEEKTVIYELPCATAKVTSHKSADQCDIKYTRQTYDPNNPVRESYECTGNDSWGKMAFKKEDYGINFYSPGWGKSLLETSFCQKID